MMAGPHSGASSQDSSARQIRSLLLVYAEEKKKELNKGTAGYIVPIVSALAVNDGMNGASLDPHVRQLLDFLWQVQDQSDGGFHIPAYDFLVPFLERDQRYVTYLAVLAVGFAPGRYYDQPSAREGFKRLQNFVRSNPPKNLHEQAVLLWAASRTPGMLTSAEKKQYAQDLLKHQNPDGGWTLGAMGAMGQWARHDGPPNDPHAASDGYATGLASLALCTNGEAATPGVERAVKWLESNQRVSGRWYTASLFSERFKNYLSNMGTAYALMAIAACDGASAGRWPPRTRYLGGGQPAP
jgi:squalene-hopene/tetraprenyl-beta-curcumene cyclase